MNSLVLAAIIMVGYFIAYHTYGKLLARKIFRLNPAAICPSKALQDHQDYIPTRKEILFGHHFTSIAGLGPIVGPAIAIIWGWVPAVLWIFFGSIFFGAVHDFGALVVSLRAKGHSIGDLSADIINKRVRTLFLLIIFFELLLLIAVFALLVAILFTTYPQAVLPVWLEIPIALYLGRWIYKKGGNAFWPSIIAVTIMYITVVVGTYVPIDLEILFGISERSALIAWIVIVIILDAWLSSSLPVHILLQPRDYINSHQLFIAMAILISGIIVAHPPIVAPAVNLAPSGAPPIWPFIFVVIACGAISGFHSIVSSGTSSKQCDSETSSLFIGYGSMLMEGTLATLVIIAVAAGIGLGFADKTGEFFTGVAAFNHHYSSWSAAAGLGSKVGAFIQGSANMIQSCGIPMQIAVSIMAVFIVSFAATTLDTATRLQRYIVMELANTCDFKSLTGRNSATLFAVISASILVFIDGSGKGALKLWPLFGTVNQLLAGLALLVITIYLVKQRVSILYTGIPMIFMVFMTGWAMKHNIQEFHATSNWLLFFIGLAVFALEIWMIIESIVVLKDFYTQKKDTSGAVPLEYLEKVSFMKNLPRVTLAKSVRFLEYITFARGDEIIRAGDIGNSMFIIKEGVLGVYSGENEDNRILRRLRPGDTVGEMALLTGERRTASVKALTLARLIKLTKEGLEKMLSEDPSLYTKFIRTIVERLSVTNRRYSELKDLIHSKFETTFSKKNKEKLFNFLDQISPMNVFNAQLCNELLDIEDADQYLKQLQEMEFAVTVDEREMFSFTPIFKEYYSHKRGEGMQRGSEQLRKIADLYKKHLHLEDALAYYLEASGYETAIEIISLLMSGDISGSESFNALPYLQKIPPEILTKYPDLQKEIGEHDREEPSEPHEQKKDLYRKGITGFEAAFGMNSSMKGDAMPLKKIIGWVLFLVTFPTLFTTSTPVRSFTIIGISAIIMWGFELIDIYLVSIFLIICCLAAHVAPPDVILSGFTSSSFFLTLGVFGISAAFVSSGLVFRMALWLLSVAPPNPFLQNLALSFIGILITPVLPSANGRLSLISPILMEMSESMGYKPNSPPSRRMAMSTLTGFALVSSLFLTGKPIHLVIQGMLPANIAAQFSWGYWFLAAFVSGFIIWTLNLISAGLLFRGEQRPYTNKALLYAQLRALGKLSGSRKEISVLVAIAFFMIGILTHSMHGLGPSWLATASMLFLMLMGGIDKDSFKSKIDWPFLFFLAGIIGFVRIFNLLGLNELVGTHVEFLGRLMNYDIFVFIIVLALVVFLIRLLLPNNVTIIILCAVLIPLAQQYGINPWMVCFSVLIFSNAWFFPYQCTFYMTFHNMTVGQMFEHKDVTIFIIINSIISVLSLLLSIPIWRLMGIL